MSIQSFYWILFTITNVYKTEKLIKNVPVSAPASFALSNDSEKHIVNSPFEQSVKIKLVLGFSSMLLPSSQLPRFPKKNMEQFKKCKIFVFQEI